MPVFLSARPRQTPVHRAQPGIHALRTGDGFLYVPSACGEGKPAPLILMLHGAGGNAAQSISQLRDIADRSGVLLLAPKSLASSWNVQLQGFARETRAIDEELRELFSQHAVDAAHVAVAGFSDGASYALSLGLANGGLFSEVLAFSPGYMAPEALRGKPRIFVSHGILDPVLNIDSCSRALVPRLRGLGYAVEYREFEGGHEVPPAVVLLAVRWFLREGIPARS
jgi:phospholipase/carboxylesterase